MELIQEFGKIAGIAGIGLGVFLFLFKDLIAKIIFPNFTSEQGYKVVKLFMFLVWSIAVIGISVWAFFEYSNPKNNEKTMQKEIIKQPSKEAENPSATEKPDKKPQSLPATQKKEAPSKIQSNVDNKGEWNGDNITAEKIIINKKER